MYNGRFAELVHKVIYWYTENSKEKCVDAEKLFYTVFAIDALSAHELDEPLGESGLYVKTRNGMLHPDLIGTFKYLRGCEKIKIDKPSSDSEKKTITYVSIKKPTNALIKTKKANNLITDVCERAYANKEIAYMNPFGGDLAHKLPEGHKARLRTFAFVTQKAF